MPDITLEIFDHLVFAALVVFFPWNARRRFRALAAAVGAGDRKARTRSYRVAIADKWLLAAVIVVAWITLGRSAASLGFTSSSDGPAIAGYALTALVIGAQLALTRSLVRTEQGRARARDSLASVRELVPHTATEKRWFDGLSVTAGICEEIVYRGFLFAYLAGLATDVPAAVVITVAALVFGLGHLYQGAAGIIKTGMVGILLGVLYWMTGSLWAPMFLHVVVDLSSGWMSHRLVGEEAAGDPGIRVAA